MMRTALRFTAALLVFALPTVSIAQPRRSGSAPRPAAPAARPAPPSRPAPAAHPAPPAQAHPAPVSRGSFNFNRDITVRKPAAPQTAPQRVQLPKPPVRKGGPSTFPHAPPVATGGAPHQNRFHGPIVRNPHGPPHNWGWNRGVVWAPAPIYWGGGFWGPWAFSALATVVVLGAVVDYDDQLEYPSYQVESNSPGAQLLADYGLQQTSCGDPDLVVIWGPGNAVICAYPNSMVAPGNYEVDPATLTLISESP